MKKQIHPQLYSVPTTCSCGEKFETRTTRDNPLRIEVCNKCHPFFTGKNRIIDTGGRVDKFNQRFKGLSRISKSNS